MKQEIINDIITYPSRVALNNIQFLILQGDRINQIDRDQAIYLTDTMKNAIEKMVEHINEETGENNNIVSVSDHLVRAFGYSFDKSIEILYKLIFEVEEGVEFNLNEMYNGGGGDQIPEYIQVKITPTIPIVVSIYTETIKYIQEKQYEISLDMLDLMKSVLFGGMYLGAEFGYRIDFNDQSELESYLTN